MLIFIRPNVLLDLVNIGRPGSKKTWRLKVGNRLFLNLVVEGSNIMVKFDKFFRNFFIYYSEFSTFWRFAKIIRIIISDHFHIIHNCYIFFWIFTKLPKNRYILFTLPLLHIFQITLQFQMHYTWVVAIQSAYISFSLILYFLIFIYIMWSGDPEFKTAFHRLFLLRGKWVRPTDMGPPSFEGV